MLSSLTLRFGKSARSSSTKPRMLLATSLYLGCHRGGWGKDSFRGGLLLVQKPTFECERDLASTPRHQHRPGEPHASALSKGAPPHGPRFRNELVVVWCPIPNRLQQEISASSTPFPHCGWLAMRGLATFMLPSRRQTRKPLFQMGSIPFGTNNTDRVLIFQSGNLGQNIGLWTLKMHIEVENNQDYEIRDHCFAIFIFGFMRSDPRGCLGTIRRKPLVQTGSISRDKNEPKYVYIYIYRERERDVTLFVYIYIYIHTYIHIHVYVLDQYIVYIIVYIISYHKVCHDIISYYSPFARRPGRGRRACSAACPSGDPPCPPRGIC